MSVPQNIVLDLDNVMEDHIRMFVEVCICHVLKILVVAGTDTIGATLEWAMLELVRHPNVVQRLQSELDSNLELGQHLEEDLASQLPYLQVKHFIRDHVATGAHLPKEA